MSGLVGVLAIVTLGLVVVYALFHFRNFLSDPKNKDHAANTLIHDGKGATSRASEGDGPAAAEGTTLKERLDDSPSSAHPMTHERSSDRV